jgi:membrane protease YdiL (CAAX protease family)
LPAGGLIQYGIILAVVLAVAGSDARELLALRRPSSWALAAGSAGLVLVAVLIFEAAVNPALHADREQGLAPTHWEPGHVAAFATSFAVLTLIGPFVEEATFRGLGYALLERYGRWAAIAVTGVLFGLAHGLVEALPILAALGVGLAWLRSRTSSLYPGVVLHGLFNAIALTLAVTT